MVHSEVSEDYSNDDNKDESRYDQPFSGEFISDDSNSSEEEFWGLNDDDDLTIINETKLKKGFCQSSDHTQMIQILDYTEEYIGNNFENENDLVSHYEETYENEYLKKLGGKGLTKNVDQSQRVSETIKTWLTEMDKKLDFIYNYEMPADDYNDTPKETYMNGVCDSFTYLDAVNEDSVEEIMSMSSNKKLAKVQGKCLLKLRDGRNLIGSWQNGRRNGQGSISSSYLDNLGVRMLTGNYCDGVLNGIGKIHMNDGSIREGWFCQGRADGPFKGVVKGSGLVWLGHYADGVPVGTCWQAVLGDAWLVGQLDSLGQMTGSEIAFVYPDLKTALVGEFKDGELVLAFSSTIKSVQEKAGILIPSFEKNYENEFRQWPSTKLEVTCPLHLRDPYEDQQVEVCTSQVSGSGDGLRTKVDIPADTLVAYYHGVRMKASDGDIFEKSTGYAIFLEWEIELRKISDVLDIAPQHQSTANYTSTLAHKINHSFKPNCEWNHALHPCYGKIPAITTLEDLKQGEELFIHYGFDMDEAPQWYQDFWM